MENKINELIKEAEKYTFDICSYYQSEHDCHYSKSTPEMQAWAAECEDFILSNYGKNSSPWRIFAKFNRDKLDGNYDYTFEEEKGYIISALTSCLRIKPKTNTKEFNSKPELDLSKVFIVHGHDDEAKSKTARFVEKLGFEAIILHEQASSSKTIIEKIEEYSNVGFGIILYTPCDVGAKQNKNIDLKPRARQNVVFEHGFLIGKIGRSNVCALVKGDVETPNDISGVVYVSMDKSDSWKYAIAKEMKKANYDVDMNKI
ncbi:MAG: putative nucleotide-binding protein [Polaribacter sp.]|jgi:predicted nucleotide-binding protein